MRELPEASKLLKQATEQNQYSSLCTLYVAMTRSKQALYMISDFTKLNSGSPLGFVKEALGSDKEEKDLFSETKFAVLWDSGDPNWYNQLASKTPDPEEKTIEEIHSFNPTHKRLNNLTASRKNSNTKLFLSGKNRFARSFGNKVHSAFQKIDWIPSYFS